MIAYFDTSAVVPLVVSEPASLRAASLWDGADRIAAVRLVYAEARAALAQAERLDRLTVRQLRGAVAALNALYGQIDLVDVDDELVRSAGDLAEVHGLRGYDAVHLAAAVRLRDPDLVMVAGDTALLDAAATEGMAVAQVP